MKRYKLDANIRAPYSFDTTFDDLEWLICNPIGRTFFIIDEEVQDTFTIEADNYEEAMKKLLLHFYPNTYEEWAENADGDCEPCGKFHKADAYYTITEAETHWNSLRIK